MGLFKTHVLNSLKHCLRKCTYDVFIFKKDVDARFFFCHGFEVQISYLHTL